MEKVFCSDKNKGLNLQWQCWKREQKNLHSKSIVICSDDKITLRDIHWHVHVDGRRAWTAMFEVHLNIFLSQERGAKPSNAQVWVRMKKFTLAFYWKKSFHQRHCLQLNVNPPSFILTTTSHPFARNLPSNCDTM